MATIVLIILFSLLIGLLLVGLGAGGCRFGNHTVEPVSPLGHPYSQQWRCTKCGKAGLMDSQGNLF